MDHGGQRQTTVRELVLRVNSAAFFLKGKGIKAGDVVAVELGRTMEHIAVRLACGCIGAVYVSVNPDYPAERKELLYRSCRPDFTFDEACAGNLTIAEYPCQIDPEPDVDPAIALSARE